MDERGDAAEGGVRHRRTPILHEFDLEDGARGFVRESEGGIRSGGSHIQIDLGLIAGESACRVHRRVWKAELVCERRARERFRSDLAPGFVSAL